MKEITSNLPNDRIDLCECGFPYVNGICSNPLCPTAIIYDNGYRAKTQDEKFPIIEI